MRAKTRNVDNVDSQAETLMSRIRDRIGAYWRHNEVCDCS